MRHTWFLGTPVVVAGLLSPSAAGQLDADFTAAPQSGALPLVVQFTDTSSGGPIVERLWDFGDGGVSENADPVHVYETPGSYTVTLEVFGFPVIADTEEKPDFIVVDPVPLVVDFSASTTAGVNPLPVEFTEQTSGTQPTGFLWDFGDGAQSTEANPTHLYQAPGAYAVTLTAFVLGQAQTLVQPGLVTVDPAPLAPAFDADVVAGPIPLTVGFRDVTTGTPPTAWLWDFGDGTASTEQHPTHTYVDVGSRSVSLTVFVAQQARTLVEKHLISADPALGQEVQAIMDARGDGKGNNLSVVRALALDDAGGVFVAASFNTIFRISPWGKISEIYDEAAAAVDLEYPDAIAISERRDVYVAGRFSHNVVRISRGGQFDEIIDLDGDGVNQLISVRDVALDSEENVYVVGGTSNNVFQVTPGGQITQVLDASGDGRGNPLLNPNSIVVDAEDNIYVGSGAVLKRTPDGTVTPIIDASGDGMGNPLLYAIDLALDAHGSIYVVGNNSNNVFRVDPDGTITQILDASGDGAGKLLDAPRHVAVDGTGNVYVSALGSENVFRVTPDGMVTEVLDASGYGATAGPITPGAIAVGAGGDVFVGANAPGVPDDAVLEIAFP